MGWRAAAYAERYVAFTVNSHYLQAEKLIMNVTFTRNGERSYATIVVRNDSVVVRVPAYDRPTALPHDVAHLLTERGLSLRHGFWGSVAAGAMFPGMSHVSGRPRPRAEEHSRLVIKRAGDRLTEAEVLVGVMLQIANRGMENDWPRVSKLFASGWQPRRPSRGPIGHDEVKAVCVALREAEGRWRALPFGAEMAFEWGGAT
jgi:hypothetical protein